LTADSTQATGLKWAAAATTPGEANTASNVGTGSGWFKQKTGVDLEFKTIIAGSTKLSVTVNASDLTLDVVQANLTLDSIGGTLGIAKGGTGQTTANTAFNALSPMTSRGDLLTRDASASARLGVGTDGFLLTADSAQAMGLKWATLTGRVTSITLTAAATASVTTDGTQTLIVLGYGDWTSVTTSESLEIKYNGTSKALQQCSVGSAGDRIPFCLFYSETPAAQTVNITLTATSGTVNNPHILVLHVS